MTDKIKSLAQDFIFGEIDTEAMLRAEIKRLRVTLKEVIALARGTKLNRVTVDRLHEIERDL